LGADLALGRPTVAPARLAARKRGKDRFQCGPDAAEMKNLVSARFGMPKPKRPPKGKFVFANSKRTSPFWSCRRADRFSAELNWRMEPGSIGRACVILFRGGRPNPRATPAFSQNPASYFRKLR
jgi:hypothetical protein